MGTLNSLKLKPLMLLSSLQELIFLEGQSVLTLPTTEDNHLVVEGAEVVSEAVVEDASEAAIEAVAVDEVGSEAVVEDEAVVHCTKNPVASLILLARK